jgi:FkbM family methyltransferase
MTLNRGYYRQRREMTRLMSLPRRVPGTTNLLGPTLHYVDSWSAAYTHQFIAIDRVYEFPSEKGFAGTILDCGANIGLSVIDFKRRHPGAKVIAFEADPAIFDVLQRNVESFKLSGVELHNAAVWNDDAGVTFASEGSDAGHIGSDGGAGISVKSVRLRDFLNEDIEFLKLDIEGAETDVLQDCADCLGKVKRVFVEYHSYAGQPQTLPDILTILSNSGFRYYIGSEGVEIKNPFMMTWTDNGQDMRINIFASRI